MWRVEDAFRSLAAWGKMILVYRSARSIPENAIARGRLGVISSSLAHASTCTKAPHFCVFWSSDLKRC